MQLPCEDDAHRLSVRFVDTHSGRNDLLGRVAALEAMAEVVARRLEGARRGSRFPLLQLVGRREPLTAVECDSLAREVVRLRHVLAPLDADGVLAADVQPPDAPSDATPSTAAERDREALRTRGPAAPPRSLADAFAWPLFVLEHIARLGAASRRGARFEVGEAGAFATSSTPLNPHQMHL